MRYVALLRGINVGGRTKLAMEDLRAVLCSLGYADVTTYIRSGNALFTSPLDDPSLLEKEIGQQIERDIGRAVKVIIRTGKELSAVVDRNPFADATASATTLHVCFLSGAPDIRKVSDIDPRKFEPDEFRVGDRVIYLRYPNGFHQTKLTNDVWERGLGLSATSRNWNTVIKLCSLLNP